MGLRIVDKGDGVHPNGRRYTPDEKQAAYLTWRIAAGRSIARTHALTGISENTLERWCREDRWAERAEREDDVEAQAARQSVLAGVIGELQKSIETVRSIRDDPTASARDRLNAATWLAGVAGVTPVKDPAAITTAKQQTHYDPLPPVTTPEEAQKRIQELRERLRRPA